MIRVLQELSRSGGGDNEDRIWHDDHFVALLDGSSSLIPSAVGGSWFTGRFVRGLSTETTDLMSERINLALAFVEKEFSREYTGSDLLYYPSAAGVFVQEKGGFLEIMAIGDCAGLFIMDDGQIITVTDDAVTKLDQEVLDFCRRRREETGRTIAELMKTKETRARLVANRQKMNQPDGYRILSIGMQPCREEEFLRLPAGKVRRIVLFSDGFETLREELAKPDASLEDLYRILRQREADDPDLEKVPRFKPGDDASALIAEIAEDA